MVMALNQTGTSNRNVRFQQEGGLPRSGVQASIDPNVDPNQQRITIASLLGGQQIQQPKFKAGDPVYGGPVVSTMEYNQNMVPTMSQNLQPGQVGIAVPPQQLQMSGQPIQQQLPQQIQTASQPVQSTGQYGQIGAENATNEYLNAGLGLLNDAGTSALNQFGGAESNTLNLLNQAGAAGLGYLDQAQANSTGAIGGAAGASLNELQSNALNSLGTLANTRDSATGALQSSTNDAMSLLSGATGMARNDAMLGYLLGGQDIKDALNNMGGYLSDGKQALVNAEGKANLAVQKGANQAISYLDPYNKAGQNSMNLQAAYSGALGPEAQRAAFAAYNNSPGQEWLRQQGEESIMNQAAATGGIGGGDVLKELQRFGTGLAQQDFQNQFDRLSTLTNQGINAGTNMGNFAFNSGTAQGANTMASGQGQAQLAATGANNATSLGAQKANMSMTTGLTMADLARQYGTTGASLLSGNGINQANVISDMGKSAAGVYQNTGAQKSDVLMNAGTNASNVFQNTGSQKANLVSDMSKTGANVMQNTAGQKADIIANMGNTAFNAVNNAGTNIAGMRYNTGTNLANQIGNASNNMANLANQQGATLADILGAGAGNITNLLSGTGTNASQIQMQIAQMLANLATGQGSQLSGLNQQLGAANGAAAAATGQGLRNTLSQGIGAWALLSDRRLKANIKKIGERKGINIYTWAWNKLSGMTGVSFGVMADEIHKIIPSAVIRLPNGFDCVDYNQVETYING